jgi:hypothetical protein
MGLGIANTRTFGEQDVHMNKRDFVRHSLGCLTVAGLSSCGYHKVRMGADTTSKEYVSSALLSADEKKLVVMTVQHHYIFDIPSPVVRALKGTIHPYVRATFSQFHVDINGKTTSSISISVLNAPNEVIEAAINAGYARTSNGAEYTTALHGERYSAGDVQPTPQILLGRTYEIEVVTEGYGYRASPIASVAGEFALGGLILFSLPIALVSGQK